MDREMKFRLHTQAGRQVLILTQRKQQLHPFFLQTDRQTNRLPSAPGRARRAECMRLHHQSSLGSNV